MAAAASEARQAHKEGPNGGGGEAVASDLRKVEEVGRDVSAVEGSGGELGNLFRGWGVLAASNNMGNIASQTIGNVGLGMAGWYLGINCLLVPCRTYLFWTLFVGRQDWPRHSGHLLL